jgi:hypothetical protein
MKIFTTRKSTVLLAALLAMTLLGACDSDIHDFTKKTAADASNEVYIDAKERTFNYAIHRTADDEVQGIDTILAKFPLHSSQAAAADIKVNLSIDNDLVGVYNAQNTTDYNSIPLANLKLNRTALTIAQGATISADSLAISYIKPLSSLTDTKGYLVPVKIVSSAGVDVTTRYEERVVYLHIQVTQGNGIYFKAGENSAIYSNNPTLGIFSDINGTPFSLYPLFETQGDVTINLAVNNDLIAAYNSAMATNYQPVPATGFDPMSATLTAGAATCTGTLAYKGDKTTLTDARGYLIPIEITTVTSSEEIKRVEAKRVFYLIVNISNLYSTVVANDSELGVKVTQRTGYNVVKFVNAATGANVTPSNGANTQNNMFNDNAASFWLVQQTGIKLNITVDLGAEAQNITGLLLEGYQASATFNMKALKVACATQTMYEKGQETAVGNLAFTGVQYLYIKFSEPVNARYIMLNEMTPTGMILALRGFFIYTSN